MARLEWLQGLIHQCRPDPSRSLLSTGLCCSHWPDTSPVVYLCIQQPGELEPGTSGQGSGAQQSQVFRETGNPCVSLAESCEVGKQCLCLARLPGQWQVSKPVPSCEDGLFLPAEGTPLL